MSDPREQTGDLPRDEGLELLHNLWGESPADALAWARRTLDLPLAPGDRELLADVDAATAARYGLHLRDAS